MIIPNPRWITQTHENSSDEDEEKET